MYISYVCNENVIFIKLFIKFIPIGVVGYIVLSHAFVFEF